MFATGYRLALMRAGANNKISLFTGSHEIRRFTVDFGETAPISHPRVGCPVRMLIFGHKSVIDP